MPITELTLKYSDDASALLVDHANVAAGGHLHHLLQRPDSLIATSRIRICWLAPDTRRSEDALDELG